MPIPKDQEGQKAIRCPCRSGVRLKTRPKMRIRLIQKELLDFVTTMKSDVVDVLEASTT